MYRDEEFIKQIMPTRSEYYAVYADQESRNNILHVPIIMWALVKYKTDKFIDKESSTMVVGMINDMDGMGFADSPVNFLGYADGIQEVSGYEKDAKQYFEHNA